MRCGWRIFCLIMPPYYYFHCIITQFKLRCSQRLFSVLSPRFLLMLSSIQFRHSAFLGDLVNWSQLLLNNLETLDNVSTLYVIGVQSCKTQENKSCQLRILLKPKGYSLYGLIRFGQQNNRTIPCLMIFCLNIEMVELKFSLKK